MARSMLLWYAEGGKGIGKGGIEISLVIHCVLCGTVVEVSSNLADPQSNPIPAVDVNPGHSLHTG